MLLFLLVLMVLYALPNLYGDNPAVQISHRSGTALNNSMVDQVKNTLQAAGLKSLSITESDDKLLIRFSNTDLQLKARELLEGMLGGDFTVASNLAPATPAWLLALKAHPMKYGLDLQGGVHFLLQADIDSVIKQRIQSDINTFGQTLRDEKLRYSGFSRVGMDGIKISFRDQDTLLQAQKRMEKSAYEFTWTAHEEGGHYYLAGVMSPSVAQKLRKATMDKTLATLRKRVNELGIAEPIVQSQGANRISVDLPGVQDTARAQVLLGKTATLAFHLVDLEHDANAAARGVVPAGTKLMYEENGSPVLLYDEVILQGSAITNATSTVDENGRPSVSVRLGGGGDERRFSTVTAQNIGKSMATVYIDQKPIFKDVDGKTEVTFLTEKKVINVAIIQAALGNDFRITGLHNMQYARDLALLLRSGALPTPVAVIESRIVGPSLGKQNIEQGERSVLVGLLLICIFMIVYYRWFGVIANLGLVFNLVMIVAILSLLGLTLTLPSIAGIVLTVGMAIDANVLINERIREELRNGLGIQMAIHAGYERAFATIVDSNVTTLIVAIVLLGLTSGAVQGFAVTLTVGILTSMFTSVVVTRGIVNLAFGGKKLKQLSIGIKIEEGR